MAIEDHVGHRVTVTRERSNRATMHCEDCGMPFSTGTTYPLADGDPEYPQVVTGVIREEPPDGSLVMRQD